MMGERQGRQERLFYEFCLEDRIPADYLLRKIDKVLDLGWLRSELAPFYSHTGRPSVDPELMIRMLMVAIVSYKGSQGGRGGAETNR